jgi:carbohydrate-selective porin OprB
LPLPGRKTPPRKIATPPSSVSRPANIFSEIGGKRHHFDFFYITDLEANPAGGLQQDQAGWQRVRGTIDINFDRLIQWKGLSFHATGLWQSGANLGANIGTVANPSDLVSAHTTRLDSFWVQQLTVGGRCNAPFPGRDHDRVGVAFVCSKISDSLSNFGTPLGGAPLGSEKAVELNYSLRITPYWYIQPLFQYYVDVGANSALPNAAVFGFRTKVNF